MPARSAARGWKCRAALFGRYLQLVGLAAARIGNLYPFKAVAARGEADGQAVETDGDPANDIGEG